MKKNYLFLRITFYLTLLLLSGCQVELYGGLNETDGNEIMAILISHNIATEKKIGKDQITSILIDEKDIVKAVKLLNEFGLPRDKYQSFGKIFKKEGLISSPLEERVRYIFALSQEIGETLSHIDGVLIARVNIVLPEHKTFEKILKPSSAAVFIKYNEHIDLSEFIPQIKKIVQNSIENLDYDKISVALFPSILNTYSDYVANQPAGKIINLPWGIQVKQHSVGLLKLIFWSLIACIVVLTLLVLYLFFYNKKTDKEIKSELKELT